MQQDEVPMTALGQHVLIDFYDCQSPLIEDPGGLRELLLDVIATAGASIIADTFHEFSPQGLTGIVAISESHCAIHTWPEHRYVAVDVFTCTNRMNVDGLIEQLRVALQSTRFDCSRIERGSRLGMQLGAPCKSGT